MAEIYKNNGSGGFDKIMLDQSSIRQDVSDSFVRTMTVNNSSNKLQDDMNIRGSWIGSSCLQNQIWYNVISCRHRNNTGDGPGYGMILYSKLTQDGDLYFNKQSNGNVLSEHRLIDNQNPEICISSTQPTNSNCKIWVQI